MTREQIQIFRNVGHRDLWVEEQNGRVGVCRAESCRIRLSVHVSFVEDEHEFLIVSKHLQELDFPP